MSTKNGYPPALWIVPAVAKKVNEVVKTPSPRSEPQGPQAQQDGVRA